jgi:hypothetical protein
VESSCEFGIEFTGSMKCWEEYTLCRSKEDEMESGMWKVKRRYER